VLAGEASGGTTIVVNTSDYVSVRGQIGQPVNLTNFRKDVNADGTFSTTDYVSIRGKINTAVILSPTCP
jgi:hypothetical protein